MLGCAVLCCAVRPIYNLLLPGRGIRTTSNRPGTTPSQSRGAARSTRTATGPPLVSGLARFCRSVGRSRGEAVRLQFRFRSQLGVRPHPVLTTYYYYTTYYYPVSLICLDSLPISSQCKKKNSM